MIQEKLKYDDVKKFFKSYKMDLITKEYKNNKTNLDIKCKDGHIFTKTLANFKKNPTCKICNKKEIQKRLNLKYEDIKNTIEQENYHLLMSEEDYNKYYKYKGNKTKIKLLCPNGHIWKVILNNFKVYNNRCKFCFYEKNKGKTHYRYNPNRNEIELNKKLRRTIYKKIKNKLLNNETMNGDFHIDHIFPIKAFSEYLIENKLDNNEQLINYLKQNIINNIENLQIISKENNYKKYSHYDRTKFLNKYENLILELITKLK